MIAHLVETLRTRTPLGWLQLRRNPLRLLVAIGGIVFASGLIFMQLGVMGALFESSVTTVRKLNADIMLMGPDARQIAQLGSIPRRRLYQSLGVEGVMDGTALYAGSISMRSQTSIQQAQLLVFGYDPRFPAFKGPVITDQQAMVKHADTGLLDELARSSLSGQLSALKAGKPAFAEIGGRTIRLVGVFKMGASFADDGVMIVSDQTFARMFNRDPSVVNGALLRVKPGYDVQDVAKRLRSVLDSSDTKVMTTDEYAESVKSFMQDNTPIGFIFTFGVIIGVVIGFAIVYQILSADVNDHMAEYATFKAMGYSHSYLLSVVFEEALLLAVLGFIPSILLAFGLYWAIGARTELSIGMPLDRPFVVFALVFGMCCLSGAVATRRLRSADPADIF